MIQSNTTEVEIVNSLEGNKEETQRREWFEKQRKDGEFGKTMARLLKNNCDNNDKGNWDIKSSLVSATK